MNKVAYNPQTKKNYTGENADRLTAIASMYHTSLEFAGLKQWNELGRKVKKGEKGYKVVIVFEVEDELSREKRVTSRTVFNKDQTEVIEK